TELKNVADQEKAAHIELQLSLQMLLGQPREWREIDKETRKGLDAAVGSYLSLFDALAAAALGDYKAAEQALEILETEPAATLQLNTLAQLEKSQQIELAWNQITFLPTIPPISAGSLHTFPRSQLAHLTQSILNARINQTVQVLQEAAQIRCLRGLLALEQ